MDVTTTIFEKSKNIPVVGSYDVIVAIAAGRNISVTDDSWDVTRVIPVCAVSGEAAGVAAANTSDFAKYPVKELRKKLNDRGVILKI